MLHNQSINLINQCQLNVTVKYFNVAQSINKLGNNQRQVNVIDFFVNKLGNN